ncbi:MAG: cytochrome c [Nitrospirae bacterium]|nr:cytochrome c [Nitrospirota bacterium]
MHYQNFSGYFVLPVIALVSLAIAACAPRQSPIDGVPPSAMEEALSYKAPFGEARTAPPEIVAAGKALYEGKGRCELCHGTSGKGDGPAAHMHPPRPPRDFTDCAFQRERKDGELFWIIKHGSPGTGMQQLIPAMLSEEEGWKIVAYVRTFCIEHS